MSLKVTGEIFIFRNDKGAYSTSISKKNEDGTYENMRISVNFKKGTELENKTKINVTNGFLSFWKNNQGLPQLKLVVLEFEKETNENENIESDLPF